MPTQTWWLVSIKALTYPWNLHISRVLPGSPSSSSSQILSFFFSGALPEVSRTFFFFFFYLYACQHKLLDLGISNSSQFTLFPSLCSPLYSTFFSHLPLAIFS